MNKLIFLMMLMSFTLQLNLDIFKIPYESIYDGSNFGANEMNLDIPILKIRSKIATLTKVPTGVTNRIKIFDFNEIGTIMLAGISVY